MLKLSMANTHIDKGKYVCSNWRPPVRSLLRNRHFPLATIAYSGQILPIVRCDEHLRRTSLLAQQGGPIRGSHLACQRWVRICNVTVQIHAVMRTLMAQVVTDTEPFALMHASHCKCHQGDGFMNILQARGFAERLPPQENPLYLINLVFARAQACHRVGGEQGHQLQDTCRHKQKNGS